MIKEGILDPKWGRLLSDLFNMRQEADYSDFRIFGEEEILPLFTQIEEFREVIKSLLAGESGQS